MRVPPFPATELRPRLSASCRRVACASCRAPAARVATVSCAAASCRVAASIALAHLHVWRRIRRGSLAASKRGTAIRGGRCRSKIRRRASRRERAGARPGRDVQGSEGIDAYRLHAAAGDRRSGRLVAGRGASAGTVALRVSRSRRTAARRRRRAPGRRCSSRPATWPTSRARPLARWLPVSGHAAAGAPGDRQGEGRRRRPPRSPCAKARPVRAGPDARAHRHDRSRVEAGRPRSARSKARGRSWRSPTRRATMNVRLLNDKFISQNAFDSAESSFSVAQGNVKSTEAQVQLAQNALQGRGRDGAAVGHRREAPRAAGREGRRSRRRSSPSST